MYTSLESARPPDPGFSCTLLSPSNVHSLPIPDVAILRMSASLLLHPEPSRLMADLSNGIFSMVRLSGYFSVTDVVIAAVWLKGFGQSAVAGGLRSLGLL